MEDLIAAVLGPGRYLMLVDTDTPCGCVAASGAPVAIESGCIVDCSELAKHSKYLNIAFNQTRQRGLLLGDEHAKEKGICSMSLLRVVA